MLSLILLTLKENLNEWEQDQIIKNNIGVWEADDEDDLIEEITHQLVGASSQ